jgi:hypothetical protein
MLPGICGGENVCRDISGSKGSVAEDTSVSMSARVGRSLALLAVLAVFAAGCSRSDAPSLESIHEQMRVVTAQVSVLRAQMDGSMGSCLRSRGFPSFPKTAAQHFASLGALYSIRFDFSPEAGAGYRRDAVPLPSSEEERGYFERLSQAEQDAYAVAQVGTPRDIVDHKSPSGAQSGIPLGGCTGIAAIAVFGSPKSYVEYMGLFDDLQFMSASVLARAETDKAFREALTDWSACMTDAGYSFKSPPQAGATAVETRQTISGPASPEEIGIATADARCQDEVSMRASFLGAAAQEERSIAGERERLFSAWDKLMARVVAQGYSSVEADGKDLISASAE